MSQKPHESDVAFIEALASILSANDLTELQVKRDYGEDGSLNVRVSRGRQQSPIPDTAPSPPFTPAAPQPPLAEAPRAPQRGDDPSTHPGVVASPMVGTAYLSAEPGAQPFVSMGDVVSEGETLLIIEAMKTMNHIPASRSGTVRRILIEDGAPVEFGAPLMIVE